MSAHGTQWVAAVAIAVAVVGCAQPGTQVPASEAAKLDVATSRMSVACGYAEELEAFGGSHPPGLPWIESIAVSGAQKLAAVYAHDQSDLYQGESVGAIVEDSLSLVRGCGLNRAGRVLSEALARRH